MKLLIILFLSINLYANAKQKMFSLYQNEKFESACHLGLKNFSSNRQDMEYISLYAFSCLKADYIDRLVTPILLLNTSKEARTNSAYFSLIFIQKKLLLHSLLDGYSLEGINLPTTDFVLSKVFDHYAKLGKHQNKLFYIFQDEENPSLSYKLYLKKGKKLDKMVIEEIYDSRIVKKHIYW